MKIAAIFVALVVGISAQDAAVTMESKLALGCEAALEACPEASSIESQVACLEGLEDKSLISPACNSVLGHAKEFLNPPAPEETEEPAEPEEEEAEPEEEPQEEAEEPEQEASAEAPAVAVRGHRFSHFRPRGHGFLQGLRGVVPHLSRAQGDVVRTVEKELKRFDINDFHTRLVEACAPVVEACNLPTELENPVPSFEVMRERMDCVRNFDKTSVVDECAAVILELPTKGRDIARKISHMPTGKEFLNAVRHVRPARTQHFGRPLLGAGTHDYVAHKLATESSGEGEVVAPHKPVRTIRHGNRAIHRPSTKTVKVTEAVEATATHGTRVIRGGRAHGVRHGGLRNRVFGGHRVGGYFGRRHTLPVAHRGAAKVAEAPEEEAPKGN